MMDKIYVFSKQPVKVISINFVCKWFYDSNNEPLFNWNLSLLHNFLIVAGQRSPTISFISQEKVADIGDTVELECTVQYSQDYPVSN